MVMVYFGVSIMFSWGSHDNKKGKDDERRDVFCIALQQWGSDAVSESVCHHQSSQ